ncbi:MAG: BMP family ABC transporter substrate-binding protein [Acidimicrobiia bacterium]
MRISAKAVAAAASIALLVSACGGSDNSGSSARGTSTGAADTASATGAAKKKIKIAYIYVAGTSDAGWTKKHDDGRKAMEKELGTKVEVTTFENVQEGASSERIFEDLAKQNYDLVFAASFGYGDQMLEVATKYPGTCFEWATGYKTSSNMGTYFGAAEEARYLSGIAAGKATKNGKVGYVAAFPIPEVIRGINAFTLGVRSVSPTATVQVGWTSTWFNPTIERQVADTLLVGGVDVITQHQDTPSTGIIAEARGAKWVGYNDDMSSFAPQAWLTAPSWDWSAYYTKTAQSVLAGTCPNSQYYGDMADGLVTLAPFGSSVDKATQDLIALKTKDIKAGTFKVFTGPVKDQAGQTRIAAGQAESLEKLLSMDYFVEGVLGAIPKASA